MTCLYPRNSPTGAYRKGCRCERCKSGKAAAARASELQWRSDLVVGHMLRNPGTIHPEDALAIVLYPGEEFDMRVRFIMSLDGCRGCYGPLDQYTRGCDTCTNRRAYNARKARKRAEVAA